MLTELNKNSYRFKNAFSLIELSIVILIIGILVAGVTQSSRLVTAMKVMSSRNAILNAPIISIQGLFSWYEPVLEKSFATGSSGTYNEVLVPDNNSSIAKWNDINPLSSDKSHAIQPNSAEQPTYVEGAINGLPALRFSGNKSLMAPAPFFDSAFSIFMVVSRNNDINWRCIVADIVNSGAGALCAGQDASITWTVYQPFVYSAGSSLAIPRNTPVVFEVHSRGITSSNTVSINMYNNGVLASSPVNLGGVVKGVSGDIGRSRLNGSGGDFWIGDIGEIIVYKRMVSNEERIEIEKYLAKKWGIGI